jgi:hypothetical protein
MRRVVLYAIGWLAAATVAVLLAWQGVGRVGTNVTDSHPRALSADDARKTLAEGTTTTIATGDQPGAETTQTSTTGLGFRPSTTRGTTRPSGVSTSTTRPVGSVTSPTATGSTTGATSSATTSPPAPSNGVVRTYNLVGGSAALRFEPTGKVTVVWANPNQGYELEVDERDGGGVRIRFEGEDHRSQLEAWWDGAPRDRIGESGEGGSSGPG